VRNSEKVSFMPPTDEDITKMIDETLKNSEELNEKVFKEINQILFTDSYTQ
jgi:hypothetical protein